MRKGWTRCKKKAELQTLIEADRGAAEAREDFWSMSGEPIKSNYAMSGEQVRVPKEPSFPIALKYIDVVRQTKTNVDNLEKSNTDDWWNIDEQGILSDHEIPFPEQVSTTRLLKSCSWVKW